MRPDVRGDLILAWLHCARLRKKRGAPHLIVLLSSAGLPILPLAPSPFQPGGQAGGPG